MHINDITMDSLRLPSVLTNCISKLVVRPTDHSEENDLVLPSLTYQVNIKLINPHMVCNQMFFNTLYLIVTVIEFPHTCTIH